MSDSEKIIDLLAAAHYKLKNFTPETRNESFESLLISIHEILNIQESQQYWKFTMYSDLYILTTTLIYKCRLQVEYEYNVDIKHLASNSSY